MKRDRGHLPRSWLIRGGWVLDPTTGLEGARDVWIQEGRIGAIAPPGGLSPQGVPVVEAQGLWVVPGLIDLHVHLREPGQEHKETIRTGTRAAVAGGFTTVCCMPNTQPVNDHRAVTELILRRTREEGVCRVLPVGAISQGSRGELLAEMGDLQEAGCVAFSDDGHPVMHSGLMRRALEYARMLGCPVISHAEDATLSEGGVMHEGVVSMELGLRGIPGEAEAAMVARDVLLAALTGAHVHIAHVSTAGAVRIIREARARGVRVTAETAPHYFTLTHEAVRAYNTLAKMNPPLRTQEDLEAIREGLRDGTLQAIATDHAPHAREEKEQEFEAAPFGIVGLETALPLTLRLVQEGVLTPLEAIHRLSTGPAAILDLPLGTLKEGALADVVLIDPEAQWVVEPERFFSRGRNTPFRGWTMKGRVWATWVEGQLVYRDGEIQAEAWVPLEEGAKA